MADDGAISFTISREGAKSKPVKSFTLRPGTDVAVRIGRAPGNDIVVEHRGASQYHAELRLLPDTSGEPRLHVRDLSMNGTGMKKAEGQQPECLVKNTNEPVPDGATLLVPMMLKAALTSNDRAWLKVEFQDPPPPGEHEKPRPPAPTQTREELAAPEVQTAPVRQQPPGAAPAPRAAAPAAAQAPARDGSASDQDEDKDAEKSRMQFVELLLKTREVSAGTTYEEARRLLASSPAWDAVDEQTRRECFEIFVEHLGNHNSKKKKKDKGKGKKEKRRHREEDEAAPQKDVVPPEAPKVKRRKDPERKGGGGSGSPHRKSKRDKKGRDKSRGRSAGGNCSRSPSRPQKRRRRGRSGSA